MGHPALYDDDILLWSEQQAEVIRRLGRTRRDLPNDFDIENVAEEIESVGRSETAAVESLLRLVMLHLIKIAIAPNSPAVSHWQEEALNFQAEAVTRFSASMAQRLDIQRAWRLACRQARQGLAENEGDSSGLPAASPFLVVELVAEAIDIDDLVDRLRRTERL